MQISKIALNIILISLLAACSSKDAMLPTPDKTMQQVYETHMRSTSDTKLFDARSLVKRGMDDNDVELSQYVRTEKNQLESKFKKIPNPTMYMFVAPHLASQTLVPIPGYLTEFKMWETENYALPGELSDMVPEFNNGSN